MANWPENGETDWNTKMKAFIEVEHNADGTHKIPSLAYGTRTDKDSENNTLVKSTNYQVTSDGYLKAFIVCNGSAAQELQLKSDSNNPPATVVDAASSTNTLTANVDAFINKNHYFRVNNTGTSGLNPTIFWHPIGNGVCVKQ